MPGRGFIIGGVIAATASPRTAFLIAGIGVFAIVAIVTPILGGNWPERLAASGSTQLDGDNAVVLELLPGSRSAQSDREVYVEKT
jgi:hypothetical protein